MNTTETYIYYDEASSDWKPASLEELAMLDNPELPVCRLNAEGVPGAQTTYSAIEKTRTAATQRPEKAPAKAPKILKLELPPDKEDTEKLLRYTLNYIRCFITFLVFVIVAAYVSLRWVYLQREGGDIIGIVIALLVASAMHFAAKRSAQRRTKL